MSTGEAVVAAVVVTLMAAVVGVLAWGMWRGRW